MRVCASLLLIACCAGTLGAQNCPPLTSRDSIGGRLAIDPSEVPGLHVDSARWSIIRTNGIESGAATMLRLTGSIIADHDTSLGGVVVVLQGKRDGALVTSGFLRDFYMRGRGGGMRGQSRVSPSQPAALDVVEIVDALQAPPRWGCPERMRVVSTRNLARYTSLASHLARDSAAAVGGRKLTVLSDSVAGQVMGFAMNPTSRTIRNAAVWFAVNANRTSGGPDTLVFSLGDVPPRAVVSFGGGFIAMGQALGAHGVWSDDEGPRPTAAEGNRVSAYRKRPTKAELKARQAAIANYLKDSAYWARVGAVQDSISRTINTDSLYWWRRAQYNSKNWLPWLTKITCETTRLQYRYGVVPTDSAIKRMQDTLWHAGEVHHQISGMKGPLEDTCRLPKRVDSLAGVPVNVRYMIFRPRM